MIQLGINIDHVATVRQARGGSAPDPVTAALLAQDAGADNITLHLREDRRHIQDRDLLLLKQVLNVPINFEMAATKEMLHIAEQVRPAFCCLVPEKRAELTTEGGLNVVAQKAEIKTFCAQLIQHKIHVSLFIDADEAQIAAAAACGAQAIELHTGAYADAPRHHQKEHLTQLKKCTAYAKTLGLEVHAGHGLNYQNVTCIAQIDEIEALMIGHAIIARSIFVGLPQAVKEMKELIFTAEILKRKSL